MGLIARIISTSNAKGRPDRGLYRSDGSGWEYLGRELDSTGHLVANSRELGYFSVFADTMAPGKMLNFEGNSLVVESGNAGNIYLWVDGGDYGLLSTNSWSASVSVP